MLTDKPFYFPEAYTDKIKFLCLKKGANDGPDYRSIGIFRRYLDLYLVGAALGISLNRLGKEMVGSSKGLTIFVEQLGSVRNNILYLYSLAMLNYHGEDGSLNMKDRIANAFELVNMDINSSEETKARAEECEKVFYRYIYGGIDYLYEFFKDLKDKSEISTATLDDLILELVQQNVDFDVTDSTWNSY